MIDASRIWRACEERNGSMRSEVPQLTGLLRVPGHTTLLTSHLPPHECLSLPPASCPQIFRCLFPHHTHLVLQVRDPHSHPSLLTESPGLPISLAPDRFKYKPGLLVSSLRTETMPGPSIVLCNRYLVLGGVNRGMDIQAFEIVVAQKF